MSFTFLFLLSFYNTATNVIVKDVSSYDTTQSCDYCWTTTVKLGRHWKLPIPLINHVWLIYWEILIFRQILKTRYSMQYYIPLCKSPFSAFPYSRKYLEPYLVASTKIRKHIAQVTSVITLAIRNSIWIWIDKITVPLISPFCSSSSAFWSKKE